MNEMTRKDLENQIKDVLKGLDDNDMVSVWNEYCYATNNYDDEIFNMDSLDEVFRDQPATYILNRAFFGHDEWSDESSFNPNREWFMLNGYGNLISMDCIGWNEYTNKFMCGRIDENAVVDYIIDNMDSLGCDEITDILDDFENGID